MAEDIVKGALEEFLKKHNPEICVSGIDDIVLSYMVSVLEDLSELGSSEENLDVDQFTEMMEAYLPGFGGIQSEEVSEWMFELASRLGSDGASGEDVPQSPTTTSSSNVFLSYTQQASKDEKSESDSTTASDAQAEAATDVDPQIQLLQEMFPSACTVEVKHCLSVSNGDSEGAAQLMLDRQESGEAIKDKTKAPRSRNKSLSELDEGKITKQHIIDRYAYVDVDEDKKSHKPVLKTNNEKKMIRYREGQIVSMKGERFSESKKELTDDMKKTYINLKPAKQYRFH